MTTAIAPRARRSQWAAINKGNPHGVDGQLNVYVLDVESDCTGYGTHQRVRGPFGSTSGPSTYTLDEDHIYDLPPTTEAERRKILNGWRRLHPKGTRLVLVSSVTWTTPRGREVTSHEYRPAGRQS